MAYMNQERKKKLAANLKAIMPKNWKYSLSVRNHSTIVLTISKAPVDLIAEWHHVCTEQTQHSGVTWQEKDALLNHQM